MKPLHRTVLAFALLWATLAQAEDVIINGTKAAIRIKPTEVIVLNGTLTLTLQPPPGLPAGEPRLAWEPPPAEGKAEAPDPYTMFTGIYDKNTTFKNLVFTILPGGSLTIATTRNEGAPGETYVFQALVTGEPTLMNEDILTYTKTTQPGSVVCLLKVWADASDPLDTAFKLEAAGNGPVWYLKERPRAASRCIIL